MSCADKPGKPGTPEVKEATKTSATLAWTAPSDNGGSDITNYVVEYRADGAFKWKRATESVVASTTYVVKGLEENIKYEFRVAAENRAGVGPPSEGSLAVKLENAMGKSSLRSFNTTIIIIVIRFSVSSPLLAFHPNRVDGQTDGQPLLGLYQDFTFTATKTTRLKSFLISVVYVFNPVCLWWRIGLVVTSSVASTKLLYAGPG